jgi:hypothetical protein
MKRTLVLMMVFALAFSACKKSDEDKSYSPTKDGIVGEWYSSGSNVSGLLATYFSIDSIYANFESNNTYLVESYTVSGTKTTYVGTYTQEKSTVDLIWNIVLNQSSPTAVVSEGIFEITKVDSEYEMQYEVAQTTPSIGATAPTADAGFGSTSGGALGILNIQNFIKIK